MKNNGLPSIYDLTSVYAREAYYKLLIELRKLTGQDIYGFSFSAKLEIDFDNTKTIHYRPSITRENIWLLDWDMITKLKWIIKDKLGLILCIIFPFLIPFISVPYLKSNDITFWETRTVITARQHFTNKEVKYWFRTPLDVYENTYLKNHYIWFLSFKEDLSNRLYGIVQDDTDEAIKIECQAKR